MAAVFIIEQDPDFAQCLCRILTAEGFEVTRALTVGDIIQGVPADQTAVALVDLHDGETIKPEEIQHLAEALANLQILVTANYKTPEVACKALGAGARDYLLKPYGTREIVERIHALAGTGEQKNRLERIADSIQFLTSLDDILRITLDQLAGVLHMADCLIALHDTGRSFSIAASRGYNPDPTSCVLTLSQNAVDGLNVGCDDPLGVPADLVGDILRSLAVEPHRPFPTIMPLARRSGDNGATELLGFVMGHGALVLHESDILEMELFLDQVSSELDTILRTGQSPQSGPGFHHEGEFYIPETSRDEAAGVLLEHVSRYLAQENDWFWVRLALDEAINNAIIHGHGEPLDHAVTNLRLKYSIGPARMIFTVEDTGDGFDHRNLPDPTADENLLNINGRGIYIMRTIMDDVVFNEKGNRVSLVKNLDGRPFAPFSAPDLSNE
jgi:serine/threonine-protein kinase RsbW